MTTVNKGGLHFTIQSKSWGTQYSSHYCSFVFSSDKSLNLWLEIHMQKSDWWSNSKTERNLNNLNKNANQMYFVLKSLKFIYIIPLYYVLDTIVSIIRSFSDAHAVSGPVCCLVRCVLQYCCVETAVTTQQDWRTQRTKAPHGTRDCICSWEAPDDGHSGVRNM